uniref:Tudor domain-containing protein 1 n=1 Tax=Melanaphis sacchari TaxID=742174 RepID=A0A2H8TF29_9HEMI
MLKYFIYIDRGGVHLKDSSFEIFPSKTSGTRKYSKPISGSYLNNIVDENEELSFCEQNNDNFDEIDDSCFENLIISDLNDSESKNNDIVPTQKNVENKLVSSKVQPFTSKSFHHKIVPKIECEANSDKLNYTKSQKDDYKSAIVAIIARSHEPITVKKVLAIFEDEQGYTFPFQKFSCGTCMDFFRLYPDMFKLEDQCSTNSIVSLEKQIILKPKITIRRQLNKTSIFNNAAITSKILNQSKIVSELLSNKDDHQKNKEPIIDESCQAHSIKSIDLFEMYDADTILDTMKVKMRSILSKHKDGILCNDFMDIYGKEYNSHFNFSEYGFKSMRDMAYKLPSVFYVKVTDDDHECILFEADRRSEFENIIDDPSLYYKNIPKTILYNLSNFFDKYRTGVKFNKLMSLYCAEYGRAYEPQKYGYSSEKHMFESLDKMVVFKNDELFTVDPFAYTKCFKSKDQIDNCDKNTILLPDHDFLLHYSGKDICNGKFKYSKVELNDQKYIKVIVAEIYNPGSFYIQLAAEVNNLNSFMDRLQLYYKDNEEKYKVIPKLIIPELACISCFEDSNLWHRATVLKIIDEENVQLLYVDYGSIEIVPKTNVRLLASQFGVFPTQAIHCGLYEFDELNYPREISESFAEMTEDHELEAQFHPPKSKDDSQKLSVTLFLNTKHEKININKKCSKEMKNHLNKNQESVRRMIYKVMQEKI